MTMVFVEDVVPKTVWNVKMMFVLNVTTDIALMQMDFATVAQMDAKFVLIMVVNFAGKDIIMMLMISGVILATIIVKFALMDSLARNAIMGHILIVIMDIVITVRMTAKIAAVMMFVMFVMKDFSSMKTNSVVIACMDAINAKIQSTVSSVIVAFSLIKIIHVKNACLIVTNAKIKKNAISASMDIT